MIGSVKSSRRGQAERSSRTSSCPEGLTALDGSARPAPNVRGMADRLRGSASTYLRQHADNPVDWWPWGAAAFEEAARRDVPVMLSVGYASCHWCHVMAHESFEDPVVAALLNDEFVPVKVDREEHPQVDAVYMAATQAMTGQGGWPMTCFLTPDATPFYAGTYFPAVPGHGMPSFTQVLTAIGETWRNERDTVAQAAARIGAALADGVEAALPGGVLGEPQLDRVVDTLAGQFDRLNGGFGRAPKFPPAMICEFLLRHHERTGSPVALEMVDATLEAMARGGIYDQLGGGFARYSVDAHWHVPHFEKMLSDNALLLRLYGHHARLTGSSLSARVTDEIGDFLLGGMRTDDMMFAVALDADTDGVEGLTYRWTVAEIQEVLGGDAGLALSIFGIDRRRARPGGRGPPPGAGPGRPGVVRRRAGAVARGSQPTTAARPRRHRLDARHRSGRNGPCGGRQRRRGDPAGSMRRIARSVGCSRSTGWGTLAAQLVPRGPGAVSRQPGRPGVLGRSGFRRVSGNRFRPTAGIGAGAAGRCDLQVPGPRRWLVRRFGAHHGRRLGNRRQPRRRRHRGQRSCDRSSAGSGRRRRPVGCLGGHGRVGHRLRPDREPVLPGRRGGIAGGRDCGDPALSAFRRMAPRRGRSSRRRTVADRHHRSSRRWRHHP